MDLFADVIFSQKAKKVDILIMWGFFHHAGNMYTNNFSHVWEQIPQTII